MKPGYRFERVKCPECGKLVPDNWVIRHMKQDHPGRDPDDPGKWTLDRACYRFREAGRRVCATAEVTGRGWVILWHDDLGDYGADYPQGGRLWTSGGLSLADASADFRKHVDRLLAEVGKDDQAQEVTR